MAKAKLMAVAVMAFGLQGCGMLDPCESWKDDVRELGRAQQLLSQDYPATLIGYEACMEGVQRGDHAAQQALCFASVAVMAQDCTLGCAKRGGGYTSYEDFRSRVSWIEQEARRLGANRPANCQT